MMRFLVFLAALLCFAAPACAQGQNGAVLPPSPATTTGTFLPSMDGGPQPKYVKPAVDPKYIDPTWANLLRAMIHYDALDISDDNLLNEYAAVAECDLYRRFFQNDFMWRKVQQDLRVDLNRDKNSFPGSFHFDSTVQLAHYDFSKSMYFFTDKTQIRNVNSFRLFNANASDACGGQVTLQYVPVTFHAVMGEPLRILGIPLKQKDAQELYNLMDLDKNTEHILYVRFNLDVTYIEPLQKRLKNGISGNVVYEQHGNPDTSVRFDTALVSASFYEDPSMSKLVYVYKPVSVEIPGKEQPYTP